MSLGAEFLVALDAISWLLAIAAVGLASIIFLDARLPVLSSGVLEEEEGQNLSGQSWHDI